MKDYAQKVESLPQPRKMLIASYFGDKILLITPLVKRCLNYDLVIFKVY